MADQKHVDIVRRRAAAIEQFNDEHIQVRLDLRGSSLSGINLRNMNLRQANLAGANLTGADLTGADLTEADLTGTDLFRSTLQRADLTKVNLSGVDLRGVNISYANLFNANLSHANLSNANFNNACLFDADLTEANLSAASLRCVDLSNACMNRSNLCKADLTFTNLFDASLADVNFGRATLELANLTNATLCRADFTEADMRRATLNGSDVTGAIFQDTYFGNTIFGDIDLTETIGLEFARHQGRSTVGVDTLFRSCGRVPERFLRECGLPEEVIASLPSFMETVHNHSCCFVGYVSEDEQFARMLCNRLQSKGIRCWLDSKEVDRSNWQYSREIRDGDRVLFCASKESLSRGYADKEIKDSFRKERNPAASVQRNVLRMIPLNLDGFMFSDDWQSEHRQQVRNAVAADFTKWQTDQIEFERQVNRVVTALRTIGSSPSSPPPPTKARKKDQSSFIWPD